MLDACRMLRAHLGGRREALEGDAMAQAAAQRWIEIIGEAASRLTPATREAHGGIPWSAMIGMRHILAHGYFDVDPDVIWNVIERDAVALEAALAGILGE
jgi:uncharacterized protein with HEPN domain